MVSTTAVRTKMRQCVSEALLHRRRESAANSSRAPMGPVRPTPPFVLLFAVGRSFDYTFNAEFIMLFFP